MIKEWFIKTGEEEEGPYSIQDLREHPAVTPDTLVRKAGTATWLRMGDVEELEDVFKDELPEPAEPLQITLPTLNSLRLSAHSHALAS